MKKVVALLMTAALLLTAASGCGRVGNQQKDTASVQVVASFYPVYIAAANLVDGVEGVKLTNLTQPTTGCLHDYQLSPQELMSLETADCLLINGAGMESFLDKVMENYPDLTIVTASDGIDMMEGEGHNHGHEEGEPHSILEEETVNPHVWVSISRYMKYVENIRDGLIAADPAHTQQYQENAALYLEKIQDLKDRMHAALDQVPHREIITFHEAFDYFAQEFNLHVAGVIQREPGTDPTARELVNIIETVKSTGCKALFAEPQYSSGVADTIARETGAQIYLLDPAVSGETDKDAYLRAMDQNLQVLLEALS
nr:metal ABC transporter substrate-binding protein [uncultured Solibaculum sp.]